MTHLTGFILVTAAAFLAGVINSVAGGGTLLTFPALLAAGVLPVTANATSTVALVPGSLSAWWGYRGEGKSGWRELAWLGVPSVLGGLVGARLVLHVGDSLFSKLVPWLILGATALFIIQEPIRRWLESGRRTDRDQEPAWPVVSLIQLPVAVYGGFFGAGMGIMMLASLGFSGLSNIHQMNRLKNYAAVCINGVAAGAFIFGGRVLWPYAIAMALGSIPGGSAGAWVAQRVGQAVVKRTVVGIGLSIGVYMLVRQLHG